MDWKIRNRMLAEAVDELANLEQFFLRHFTVIYDVVKVGGKEDATPGTPRAAAMYAITSACDIFRGEIENEGTEMKARTITTSSSSTSSSSCSSSYCTLVG